jgi:hypothetical protein
MEFKLNWCKFIICYRNLRNFSDFISNLENFIKIRSTFPQSKFLYSSPLPFKNSDNQLFSQKSLIPRAHHWTCEFIKFNPKKNQVSDPHDTSKNFLTKWISSKSRLFLRKIYFPQSYIVLNSLQNRLNHSLLHVLSEYDREI